MFAQIPSTAQKVIYTTGSNKTKENVFVRSSSLDLQQYEDEDAERSYQNLKIWIKRKTG